MCSLYMCAYVCSMYMYMCTYYISVSSCVCKRNFTIANVYTMHQLINVDCYYLQVERNRVVMVVRRHVSLCVCILHDIKSDSNHLSNSLEEPFN